MYQGPLPKSFRKATRQFMDVDATAFIRQWNDGDSGIAQVRKMERQHYFPQRALACVPAVMR
jgi:hypothetical protein